VSSERSHPFESPIEERLAVAMRDFPDLAGLVPQFEIRDDDGEFVSRADFAFPEEKYAVYCDGREWHVREDLWQRDLRQRNRLAELGWTFSVFSGREILTDADACARQVGDTFMRRKEQRS
jgi:very-short-patch-repair endonuclease